MAQTTVSHTEKIADLEQRITELEEQFAWIRERIEGRRGAPLWTLDQDSATPPPGIIFSTPTEGGH